MNFPYEEALLWIILAPLCGAIIVGLFGRYADKGMVTGITVGSVALSFVLSCIAFSKLLALGPDGQLTFQFYEWFSISHPGVRGGHIPVNVRFVMDSLSGIMCVMVTGIATLIHIYSVGYMSEEKSYARFFAYLNLFTASMLVLVLASNLPLMFVGWEGVGLCSYLLVGFWWTNPAYAAAGRKAFVANRVGDFGVLIGMFILVATVGSFEFAEINDQAHRLLGPAFTGVEMSLATLACLFLFLGCTGKSAQIPLYIWLPDAMAGPTPVSALIHAATMVTSGIYLCCRLSGVFIESPTAMTVIALIGTATALLAASIAVVQREMKKILAYSTVSQLGFMFAAVGVGAFGAGIFHVFTHAFFKACLFLGAGSVMHAVGAHGDANIFKLGGLRKILPRTHGTFLVACMAIAGVPLFAGFFSKDEILLGASLLGFAGDAAFSSSLVGWVVLVGLTIAATLTAFYMFRLYFLTFSGTYRSAGEGGAGHDGHGYDAHPHESPSTMTIPLIVLAAGSVLAGFLGLPHAWGIPFLHSWWGPWLESAVAHLPGFGPHDHIENGLAVAVPAICGIAAAGVGIGAAYKLYNGSDASADRVEQALPKRVFAFLLDKWRVDELYEAVILGPIRKVAVLVGRIDQTFVDALLTKAVASGVRVFGWVTTRPQVGVVQAYGLAMVLGVAGMSYWILYPHPSLEATQHPFGQVELEASRGVGYTYRWDADGDGTFDTEAFGAERTASNNTWQPESFVGVRLLLSAPGVPNGPEYELEVGEEPLLLTGYYLGRGWQGDVYESTTPPAITFDAETNEIVVHPNLVRPSADGEPTPLPEIRLRPGQRGRLGPFIQLTAAPVVRPRVEVRNAFGNVTTDSVEVVLHSLRPTSNRISLNTSRGESAGDVSASRGASARAVEVR